MEAALYGLPGGFYQRRTPRRDFYTAPELHPAFGRILGRELGRLLGRLDASGGPLTVLEAGCGDGTLFRAVAEGLEDRAPDLRFVLADRSLKALEAARRGLPAGLKVELVEDLRDAGSFRGAIYSNELLDALPFHLLEKREGEMREVVVEGGRPAWASVPPGPLADAAKEVAPGLTEGGRHAVCLDAETWLTSAAAALESGWLVSVDYGSRRAPGAPVRPRTYREHRIGEDLFAEGADLTAPVDFRRVEAAGERLGLRTEWYGTLSRFLIDRGIVELTAEAGPNERNKLKTLFHPDGMGEVFKVLIQSKNVPTGD